MHILTFSTLFPNAAQPRHGLFVEQRVRQLVATGAVRATVVAPVPWFPAGLPGSSRYDVYAAVPARETRDGIEVHHPRYPVIPKIGMSVAAHLMDWWVSPFVRRLYAQQRFDLLDAHYFYPDGVAAARIGRRLGLPVVVTARGSDVNLLPEFLVPRRLILRTAQECAGVATVSMALRDRLVQLGVDTDRIVVLRNGVDLSRFAPSSTEAARAKLGVHGPTLLMVGNLVPEKGHALALRAMTRIGEVQLLVVGDGPLRQTLEAESRRLGLQERVRFVGAVTQAALPEYYNAADALILASEREGLPNVVLEALACGTPVASVRVGGVPEVITSDAAGRLADERTPESLAQATAALLARPPQRTETRRFAERFGWEQTTRGQIALFERVSRARQHLEMA